MKWLESMDRKHGVRQIAAGAILFATLFALSTCLPSLAEARNPGSCYCIDESPPYAFLSTITGTQTLKAQDSGSNSYTTSPWFDTEDSGAFYTGEMGLDQASLAGGSDWYGSYEWATLIGLQNGQSSAFWGSTFESGQAVTFYWDWYLNWAYVPSLTTSDLCTLDTEYGGSLTVAANVHDVTTNSNLLSNAYTLTVDSESSNPYAENLGNSYDVSFQVSSLNSNDQYEMQGWIIGVTQAYIDGCGTVQVNYNFGDSGGYATLQEFGAYSS